MTITPLENFRTSIRSVWLQPLRSLLTVLGIVIGITTVVTVASLLSSVEKSITDFFRELGPDNIFISKSLGPPRPGASGDKIRRRPAIGIDYASEIKQFCSRTVKDVGVELQISQQIQDRSLAIRAKRMDLDSVSLVGASANMNEISPRDLAQGRFFTTDEDRRGANVVVIGANIADALFPRGHASGHSILIDGDEFTVIGTFAKAKVALFGDGGQDNQALIPLQTARRHYSQLNDFFLVAHARPDRRREAYEDVRALMRRLRQIQPAVEDNFELGTPDQIIRQFDQITGIIGAVAICISAVGLLVGGIGVMNIMLVSVTERTREIGVRKAIGARRKDIVNQFLIEAVALSGTGGLLGIFASVGVTLLAGLLLPSLPTSLQWWAVFTGLGVSMAVGLFFGVWPAVKASKLNPVVALRYE